MSGIAATNAARWNGQVWSAMGVSPGVRAFASFDRDGPGPQPARLHSVDANNVSYWDGAAWITAGSPDGPLRAIAVHDPDAGGPVPPSLYVGGAFTMIDGVAATGMAVGDGVAWSPLGSGIPAPPGSAGVVSLASSHHRGFPALFAGGSFPQAGGSNSNAIAAWLVDAGLTLTFSSAAGGLVVRNDSCRPGASYFDAFSLDLTNASQPGSGWWAGLFIDAATILEEYAVGGVPFLGTLDPAGTSVYAIDPGTQAALSGLTVYAVTRTFDPALLSPFDASNIASHQF